MNILVRLGAGIVGIWLTGAAVVWAEDETPETAAPAASTETASPDTAAVAEAAPADSGPAATEEASVAEPAAPGAVPAVPQPVQVPGVISVDFKDADIRQVLRVISLKSGVDIVAGSDVEGLVTIKLTNVPWEQALDIILKTYGFAYERKNNVVRVMTVAALEQEALSTGVFPLNYAKAKDVPDVVKEMLSDRGRVKFDERTNTVIVTDISANLFQIEQVVKRLDQRTPQVMIETKVIETRLGKSEQLGINWGDSLSFTNSVVSVPSSFPFPAGSSYGKVGSLFIPRADSQAGHRVPNAGGTLTLGTLASSQFQSVFNFLQSRTDTHIVSNPTIAALNNQQAKIHIGDEYPVPNYSIDPSSGRTTITGYTPKNLGTVLTVTPHVNISDEIVVDLKPEVIAFSENVSFNTGSGSAVSLPRFTIQTAQTQVRINNSDTIAIGGLIKSSDVKTIEKGPFLGDIPIIGLLFKNTSRYGTSDPVKQDLLIFLTVKLQQEEAPATQSQTVAVISPEDVSVKPTAPAEPEPQPAVVSP